jgi:excinuclease ABC subunit C
MPHRQRYRRYRIKTVEGSNDPAMMEEAVARRLRQIEKEGAERPDLILVDGGVAQLRGARRVLDTLGVTDVPVAGLAKRYEEIHWDDGGPPLRLDRDSRALHVLQRLRDEAHRFALTYHRTLRRRRIRDSVLDDIPGIGEKRKQQILQHFGSVQRLAKATVCQIAGVPGIGPQMAAAIKQALS